MTRSTVSGSTGGNYIAMGRWCSARLRLHAAVAGRAWRRGRMSSGGTKTATMSDISGISANQTTAFDSETIRGRIGYAADNILFYGTGGLAWSNDQFVRTQLTGTLNSATAGTDEAVNKGLLGMDGGRRYCLRLRTELESSSPSIAIRASERRCSRFRSQQLTTNSTINAERARTRCELQIHFERPTRRCGDRSLSRSAVTCFGLQIAAALVCL